MARTFVRQVSQIRQSTTYDDTVSAGSTMESSPTNIEDDLNSLRSQVKRWLYADSAGNWYDDVPTVNSKKRGISDLNTDLDDIEEKRLLFRVSNLTDVSVPASQNYVILGTGELPSETTAAIGAVSTVGTVVAYNSSFGSHDLAEVAGTTALSPKNLLVIVDADTGDPILSSGRTVYGLLQSESNTDGSTITDTTPNRVQISFVRENSTHDDLEACAVADIESKDINYAYVRRIDFDSVPEQAFLAGSFVDNAASVDVTLDNAIDNQSGPATQAQDIEWRIDDTYTLAFEDSTGARNLLELAPNAAGDAVNFTTDDFSVTNTNTATFSNGVTVDSGGTGINLGESAGQIDSDGALTLASAAANDLTINAGSEILLVDVNKTGSTWSGDLKLSETTAEWDAYETAFGEVSLMNAIVQASTAENRAKYWANLTANVSADTNVTGAGGSPNLDAQLGDYSGVTFVDDVDIYLNGILLRPGADASANNDVYPGTTPANGDLKFEYNIHQNDVLTMVIWGV